MFCLSFFICIFCFERGAFCVVVTVVYFCLISALKMKKKEAIFDHIAVPGKSDVSGVFSYILRLSRCIDVIKKIAIADNLVVVIRIQKNTHI